MLSVTDKRLISMAIRQNGSDGVVDIIDLEKFGMSVDELIELESNRKMIAPISSKNVWRKNGVLIGNAWDADKFFKFYKKLRGISDEEPKESRKEKQQRRIEVVLGLVGKKTTYLEIASLLGCRIDSAKSYVKGIVADGVVSVEFEPSGNLAQKCLTFRIGGKDD